MQTPSPCPKCGEYNLYRSHSHNGFERALKWVFRIKIFRCHSCNWRGVLLRRLFERPNIRLRTVLFYILLIAFALMVASMLRRYME